MRSILQCKVLRAGQDTQVQIGSHIDMLQRLYVEAMLFYVMYSEEKHDVWRKARPFQCTTRLPCSEKQPALDPVRSPERQQEEEAEADAAQCRKRCGR